MQIKTITRITAALLIFSALFFTAALVAGLTIPGPEGGWFTALGYALYLRFLAAAFYIPMYLTACGLLLLLTGFRFRHIQILLFTLLPFITLSLFLQLVTPGALPSPASELLTRAFGRQGGPFALLTLLMVEMLILMRLALHRPASGAPDSISGEMAVDSAQQPSGAYVPDTVPSVLAELSSPTISEVHLSRERSGGTAEGSDQPEFNEPVSNENPVEGEKAGDFSSLLKESLAPVLNSPNRSVAVKEAEPAILEPVEEISAPSPIAEEAVSDSVGPEIIPEPQPEVEVLPSEEVPEPQPVPAPAEDPVISWETAAAAVREERPEIAAEVQASTLSGEASEPDFPTPTAWEAPDDPEDFDETEDPLYSEPGDSEEPEDPFVREMSKAAEEWKESEEEFIEEDAPDSFGLELAEDLEEEPQRVLITAPVLPQSEGHAPAAEEVPESPDEKSAPVEPEQPKLPPKSKTHKIPKSRYKVPEQLLSEYADGQYWIVDDETREASEVLKRTLEEFKIAAEVTGISKGPVITMFEILPAPGVKLSKIVNLADNIALGLAASSVRIVAPIPGKHAVGIEVPNKSRAIVSFKEMLESENRETRKMQVPVILGKDITGGARIIDLVQTPHLLIAGATGSGKSVCVNSLICSILYRRKPDEVKMILIDPKIVELKLYNGIPHLLTPVITDPKRAFKALQYAIYEMERRYSLLDNLGVREIKSYNARVKEQKLATDPLPYIVIVVDEFADLMATSGKELEGVIARLTAMSRAVGIHLVLATQRPSVDVITGLIKANVPSRIAFMVASKFDSRIILDEVGAEKLLGKGDMLLTSAWDPNPVRMQGAFLSEEEAERVADHVKSLGEPEYIDDEIFMGEDEGDDFQLIADTGRDPLFETAVSIVIEAGKASASYLQRRLKVGYNRAARLVEEMEMRGIVGPANGSKPREIIHIPDRAPSGVSGPGIDTGTSVPVNGLGQAGPGMSGSEV